jgi:hypothetical protein
MHFPIRPIRWLLTGALLGCLYLAGHGALLLYLMNNIGGVSVFQPSAAEAVGRDAAPFQLGTKETDGMFRIVQQQHRELDIMFSRLQTADELNWSLAVVGTVAAGALAFVLGACLVLLTRTRHAGAAHTA